MTLRRSPRHRIAQSNRPICVVKQKPLGEKELAHEPPHSTATVRFPKQGCASDEKVIEDHPNSKTDIKDTKETSHPLPKSKKLSRAISKPKQPQEQRRRPRTLREIHGNRKREKSENTVPLWSGFLADSEVKVSFTAQHGPNNAVPLQSSWSSFTTEPDDGNFRPVCPPGQRFEVPKEWLERRKILGERQATDPL